MTLIVDCPRCYCDVPVPSGKLYSEPETKCPSCDACFKYKIALQAIGSEEVEEPKHYPEVVFTPIWQAGVKVNDEWHFSENKYIGALSSWAYCKLGKGLTHDEKKKLIRDAEPKESGDKGD